MLTFTYTLPETSNSPLKMGGWKTIRLHFGAKWAYFLRAFTGSFRDGYIPLRIHGIVIYSIYIYLHEDHQKNR